MVLVPGRTEEMRNCVHGQYNAFLEKESKNSVKFEILGKKNWQLERRMVIDRSALPTGIHHFYHGVKRKRLICKNTNSKPEVQAIGALQ